MKLILGTAQFGSVYGIANKHGQTTLDEIKLILNKAKYSKVEFIDTAINYNDAETNLGKIGIDNFKIITKLPKIPDNIISIEDWIENEIINSLNRLNIKNLIGISFLESKRRPCKKTERT